MTGYSGLFPNTVGANNYMNWQMPGAVGSYTSPKTSNMIRVNGIDSARAYPTNPNTDTMLFDENEDVMYLKTTDASNFPTIRKFRFVEEKETARAETQYVTMEEFKRFKEEILNGKQLIRTEPAVSDADDQSAQK